MLWHDVTAEIATYVVALAIKSDDQKTGCVVALPHATCCLTRDDQKAD